MKSCRCPPKRPYVHIDFEGEEDERMSRRSSKAPKTPVGQGRSDIVERTGERNLGEPGLSAMPPMTTTARRALGTTNPTITPSHISAFVLSVKDAKLLNLSSDFLPDEILHALQSKSRY